jgi:hypothetical protein
MSTVFMSTPFFCGTTFPVGPNPVADYYGRGKPDFLQPGVHISFVIVQPSLLIPAKAVSP